MHLNHTGMMIEFKASVKLKCVDKTEVDKKVSMLLPTLVMYCEGNKLLGIEN